MIEKDKRSMGKINHTHQNKRLSYEQLKADNLMYISHILELMLI